MTSKAEEILSMFSGFTSSAAEPDVSSIPEPKLVITGQPHAIASMIGRPNPSQRLG